eukprot:jgi/Chrzof1/3876/Cz13g11300.t1
MSPVQLHLAAAASYKFKRAPYPIILTAQLLAYAPAQVVRSAHAVGLRTTSTIMFGHIDSPTHWAQHLLLLRELQQQTGGITEFVPLPFVHMEAPIYRRVGYLIQRNSSVAA